MTEAEWLTSKRSPDLANCVKRDIRLKNAERKFRLSACACCRRHWSFIAGTEAAEAIEIAEAFADGAVNADELERAGRLAEQAVAAFRVAYQLSGMDEKFLVSLVAIAGTYAVGYPDDAFEAVSCTTNYAAQVRAYSVLGAKARTSDLWRQHKWVEYASQADLLRDIFGNPFRPVTFSPEWCTDTATALTRQMYEPRDFGAMPILADALQDAGCENVDILNHCRGPGPHVRGCWVVDLVLGKE